MYNYKMTLLILPNHDAESIASLYSCIEKQTLFAEGALQVLAQIQNRKTPKQASILHDMNEMLSKAEGEYVLFIDTIDRESDQYCEKIYEVMKSYPKRSLGVLPVTYTDGGCESRIRLRQGTEAAALLHRDLAYGLGITNLCSIVFRNTQMQSFRTDETVWEAKQDFINGLLEQNHRLIWFNELSARCDTRRFCTFFQLLNNDLGQFLYDYFGSYWLDYFQTVLKKRNHIPFFLQYSMLSEFIEICSLLDDNIAGMGKHGVDVWKMLVSVLRHIEDHVMIDALGMHDMSRILLFMNKKYGSGDIVVADEDMDFKYGETIVGKLSYQSVVLHFINVCNGILKIEGESSVPACLSHDALRHGVEVNGTDYYPEIEARTHHREFCGELYEYADTFCFRYSLDDVEECQIRFFMKYDEVKVYYHAITCMRFAPVASIPDGLYAVREKHVLYLSGNTLYCRKAHKSLLDDLETEFTRKLKKNGLACTDHVIRFRRYYHLLLKKKKRPIWLFFDRIDKADDNGEALFRYVCSHKSIEADCYFVIEKTSHDFERLKQYGRVVPAYSIKHKMLFALADYIFTSQLNGFVENPYAEAEMYYRDLQHQAKVVFLQHGITKDDHTKWLNRFNQNLTGLVSSSGKETAAFLEYPYYYEKAAIWETGMPRYDLLYHEEKRRILVMPTWRESLMRQVWNPERNVWEWRAGDAFLESDYCKVYSELLSDHALIRLCKQYGYGISFLPHPLVQPYRHCFAIHPEIEVLSMDTVWRDAFAKCDLMITDYSSVAFDFAYLRKPVLYFQFDEEAFFSHHTYRKGYFDYREDGFGEVITKKSELLPVLQTYLQANCALPDKYEKRINDYFRYSDQHNCERILDMVKSDWFDSVQVK